MARRPSPRHLAAFVRILQMGDADVVRNATAAAATLSSVSACDDTPGRENRSVAMPGWSGSQNGTSVRGQHPRSVLLGAPRGAGTLGCKARDGVNGVKYMQPLELGWTTSF